MIVCIVSMVRPTYYQTDGQTDEWPIEQTNPNTRGTKYIFTEVYFKQYQTTMLNE